MKLNNIEKAQLTLLALGIITGVIMLRIYVMPILVDYAYSVRPWLGKITEFILMYG